ncbi:MAG: DAK2 domain-containing protein [Dehalococcoidia bacterium]
MNAQLGASNITGDAFRQLVAAGTRCVESNVDAINGLNVFPVPDGDTGINMLLTLKSANGADELPPPGTGSVAEVSRALARGALLGARGNSGVIFSQFMKGLSLGLSAQEECDGAALAQALASASAASYQAVGKPVEGTMLSVMRAAAEAVQAAQGSPVDVLGSAFDAAEKALAYTPEQLPILKEAGVVDAGGQGVVAFLAGALGYLSGTEVKLEISVPAGGLDAIVSGAGGVSHDFLEHTEEEMYGYCTQFIIEGESLDVDEVRREVMALAASTVVVGDERTIRVHAHAEDPEPLLDLGRLLGSVERVSVQNMDEQHQHFMARHGYTSGSQTLAVVAVAAGEGIEQLFANLGASAVVQGGQTMNPSAADLLDAVERANAEHTVLLPNNGNIVMAAEQAAKLSDGTISVVPSKSMPQGVAALLAFNPELDADANVAAMTSAMGEIRSGEVTTAVRSTTISGVGVTQGQAIAMLDGELVAAADSPQEAMLAMLVEAEPEEGSLVTLYYGEGVTKQEADEAVQAITARFPGTEVEVLAGGQPHYQYFVSVE